MAGKRVTPEYLPTRRGFDHYLGIPYSNDMTPSVLMRDEKVITVAAGDNVVRLLPPLIISEQEMAEGISRLDSACAKLAQAHARKQKQETAG